jgi:hypothetical protein
MKKFTVKDFISYNNPCFSCGSKIWFRLGLFNTTANTYAMINPVIFPDSTDIDLKITYSRALKLKIFHKTNKFQTSDLQGLTDYLSVHKVFCQSYCDKCKTCIESHFLEINFKKGFINPISIAKERLHLTDTHNTYSVCSHFLEGTSVIAVFNNDHNHGGSHLNLPLLPLYKIGNRENLLSKIKTYLIFS